VPAWLLSVVQLLCVASIVVGIALIYVPAAFITAGVVMFVICETPALARRP
jgi:hypothetical protein